jgi:hypothetical protein
VLQDRKSKSSNILQHDWIYAKIMLKNLSFWSRRTEMVQKLVSLINKQDQILFRNLESLLEDADEEKLRQPGSWSWPPGEQVYHMVHSMDKWLINPEVYEEPLFEDLGIQRIEPGSISHLTKPELQVYWGFVKAKVNRYIETLTDVDLNVCPEKCRFTRLELILGQYRHFMYHIGLAHGCIRSETGHNPEYIGLG